ncbi:hypothetical protein GW17_00003660 [Ensete ventricosum]|uniref:Uncharacterized protein n=1 Tax=Ensete ventricosum TaxID=4639 RepID=A0A444GA12_ENSVE|nr:hypothetical protein B296_00019002 [Ensete ventricosum]RWW31706.1 hypothetical protein GW17_00003660 [Ensete ventricosum]
MAGVCNLCNGGVRFVRDNDPNRYQALQGESGRKLLQRCGRSPDDISSVVLVEKDRYLGSNTPSLNSHRFVRDFAYDNVANNRYSLFGRSESRSCEI